MKKMVWKLFWKNLHEGQSYPSDERGVGKMRVTVRKWKCYGLETETKMLMHHPLT